MKYCWILFMCSLSFASLSAQESAGDYEKVLNQYRKDYKKALVADELSPLASKQDAKEVSFYEADQSFVVKCLFVGASDTRPFEMSTFSGETKPYIKFGELLFEIPGKGTQRLSVYKSLKALKLPKYKDLLFIPFKDLTSGESTFEGGRYIDIKQSDIKQGIVMLDFNKAYNPWCAYREGFSCPIPPVENHLKIAVEAGEFIFKEKEDFQKS